MAEFEPHEQAHPAAKGKMGKVGMQMANVCLLNMANEIRT